jgi:ADP-ribosylglycohydrolase
VTGVQTCALPICNFWTTHNGYRDRATTTTLENLAQGKKFSDCGSPSTDLGGAVRFVPLLLCCDDFEQLLAAVKAQTQLTHNGPGIVDGALFLARSCHLLLSGTSPHEAFEHAMEHPISDPDLDLRLRRALDLSNISVEQAAKDFGQMCSINAALPTAVYTVLRNEMNLEQALLENVMAGGDSAARGMAIGMLLGAKLGIESIPARWLEKMSHYSDIKSYMQKLAK